MQKKVPFSIDVSVGAKNKSLMFVCYRV